MSTYMTNMTIFMSPDLQCWRRQNHCQWSDLHLLKTNISTWIK